MQALKDLPDEIPLQLTLGTKVTARYKNKLLLSALFVAQVCQHFLERVD
jgi:hypothetical protein